MKFIKLRLAGFTNIWVRVNLEHVVSYSVRPDGTRLYMVDGSHISVIDTPEHIDQHVTAACGFCGKSTAAS